jgi:hypothetical protein
VSGTACDFCSEPNPGWLFQAGRTGLTVGGVDADAKYTELLRWDNSEPWAACTTCKDAIEQGPEKMAQVCGARWEAHMDKVHPEVGANARSVARTAAIGLWAEFLVARRGPARPWKG